MVSAKIIVSGRVQGVFYRARTQERARAHGIAGWVRNCPDGRVEALLEGDREAVSRVITWCRQGPPSAHVTGLEVSWGEASGEFTDFSIKY